MDNMSVTTRWGSSTQELGPIILMGRDHEKQEEEEEEDEDDTEHTVKKIEVTHH